MSLGEFQKIILSIPPKDYLPFFQPLKKYRLILGSHK